MAGDGGRGKARRPYRSALRAGRARATRAAILDAAHALFVARGYAATSVRAVATTAGVSVPTVEQHFGTKRALLKTVLDVTKAGDDEPVPLLDRDPARAALTAPTSDAFLARIAAEIGTVAARTGPLHDVLAAAASGDTEIAGLAREIDAQRRTVASWLVDGLRTRGGLRPGLSSTHAVDVVWTLLDPALHRRLTRDCGWSTGEYADWLADGIGRLVVR